MFNVPANYTCKYIIHVLSGDKIPVVSDVIVNGVSQKATRKSVVLKKGTNATFEVDFKAGISFI